MNYDTKKNIQILSKVQFAINFWGDVICFKYTLSFCCIDVSPPIKLLFNDIEDIFKFGIDNATVTLVFLHSRI